MLSLTKWIPAVWTVMVFLVVAAHPASAEGVFVGAAVGKSNVAADLYGPFDEHHTAFAVSAGIRADAYTGVELEYFNLGHPHRSVTAAEGSTIDDGDISMHGFAAYGAVFLPWRSFDLFAKGGLARTSSTLNIAVACPASAPKGSCPVYPQERTNTALSEGGGVQFRHGSFALRAEYQRFSAAGGHPTLLSLGLLWNFD